MAGTVSYYAVYRSDTTEPAERGYHSVCTGLFGDVDEALLEARRHLADGYHVMVDCGEMTQEDWDELDEVPDDFVAEQVSAGAPS